MIEKTLNWKEANTIPSDVSEQISEVTKIQSYMNNVPTISQVLQNSLFYQHLKK